MGINLSGLLRVAEEDSKAVRSWNEGVIVPTSTKFNHVPSLSSVPIYKVAKWLHRTSRTRTVIVSLMVMRPSHLSAIKIFCNVVGNRSRAFKTVKNGVDGFWCCHRVTGMSPPLWR